MMDYVRFGTTGMKVSRICLGCMGFGNTEWTIELEESRPIIQRALDLGINFFDTANVYAGGRSEEITGEVLRGHRDDVIIATKVFNPMGEGPNDRGLSRVHILRQIEASLQRLQTDYVDLYQTHRWDYTTPIDETLRTLDNLVHQGKIRYFGASSMYAWQFAKSLWTSERLGLERFISMQNHYNLVYREEEREMIKLCQDQGIAVFPWSPLARGFLTGRYKRNQESDSARYKYDRDLTSRYFRSEDFDVVERVEEVAREKGVTTPQIACAWLLHKDYVTVPIIGVTKIEHLDAAVEALEIKLSSADIERLEEPYVTHPIIGHS